MPRYLVERSSPTGWPSHRRGRGQDLPGRGRRQRRRGGHWLHSYVTPDKQTTSCVYDGPNPEAIRQAAEANQLPVDRITEVRVLAPYFYR